MFILCGHKGLKPDSMADWPLTTFYIVEFLTFIYLQKCKYLKLSYSNNFISAHCSNPDCRVCQRRTREFLNKKILVHLGAVYSKFYTLFWPKTLYLHCILQGFYHFSFFGWLFKSTYKYFCAPAPQCFAFVHPRSRRKVPYSAVWAQTVSL